MPIHHCGKETDGWSGIAFILINPNRQRKGVGAVFIQKIAAQKKRVAFS